MGTTALRAPVKMVMDIIQVMVMVGLVSIHKVGEKVQ
jgi:hypothetical protein